MRIGLDIDEVLADFSGYFLDYLNIEDRTAFRDFNDPRIRNNFHRIENDEEFWMTIPRLIDPNDLDFIPVIYVTARNIPTKWTRKWLDINGFPPAPIYSVGHEGSKVEVLKGKVDVFVDDAYHNYKELNEGGVKCLLLTKTHNLKYNRVDKRISKINQALNYD